MMKIEESLLEQCSELLNKIRDCPENKKCFDCTDTTSPRYVCTDFSTFVCSCCANIHKEFGHNIKYMNVFACNLNDVLQLKATGNKPGSDKWLARWTPADCPEPDPSSPTYKEDARNYFRLKYIEKRWTKKTPPIPHRKQNGSESFSNNSTPITSPSQSPSLPPIGFFPSPIPSNYTHYQLRQSSPEYAQFQPNFRGISPPQSPDQTVNPMYPQQQQTRANNGNEESLDDWKEGSSQSQQQMQSDMNRYRAATYPTPPLVYQYMPQQMYAVPMPLSPAQFGFPQYSQAMPVDMSHLYYHQHPASHQQPSRRPHSFQFLDRQYLEQAGVYGPFPVDNNGPHPAPLKNDMPMFDQGQGQGHPMMSRSISHAEGLTRLHTDGLFRSQTDPRLGDNEEDLEPAMMRSASANSVMVQQCTHEAMAQKGEDCKVCPTCGLTVEPNETKTNNTNNTINNTKWKVNSIMNKMASLITTTKKTPAAKVSP